MTLSDWLLGRIRGRGWSQRRFAAAVEISPTEVTDILHKGHVPGLAILQRIANEFDTSLAFLLQLLGYSVRERKGIAAETARLAQLLQNSPLLTQIWEELETATPEQLDGTLTFIRFLKS